MESSEAAGAGRAAEPPRRVEYRTQSVAGLDAVDAGAWDALVDASAAAAGRDGPLPLLRHGFLRLLEATGCVGEATGWTPAHLLLRDADGALAGAVPLYRKSHSYGEFVFDWAWADAYQRHGRRYYPKWLSAIPFTPVPGPRLLARDAAAREALAAALLAHARSSGLSSLHVLYPEAGDAEALQRQGLMLRTGVQFHWQDAGFGDFEGFLASLAQPKRKKIRAERRKVAQAGVTHRWLTGEQIDAAAWDFFTRCYATTYAEHGSTPYLTAEFFAGLQRAVPGAPVLLLAERGGRPVASSLLVRDGTRLYGRYWGAREHVDCLHFETCFYQAIEYALAHGCTVVEGGAQGEHKMARGFLPVATRSLHWLAEPAFADAVDRFLAREGQGVSAYLDELAERTPFRGAAGG